MALRRAQVPRLPGIPRVAVAARQVPAFASPSGGGPVVNEVVDLGPLTSRIGQFLTAEARRVAAQEIERGKAFVARNPELVQDVEQQAADVAGPNDLEQLRSTFAQLVEQGQIPEAASPFFQIGFVQQRARAQADAVRSSLIAQLPDLTRVDENGETPDIDEAMQQAFAEAAASPSATSVYGADVFNAARSQVEDEIRRRYDEGRVAGIQQQHRSLFRDSLGAALSQVTVVNEEDVESALIEVNRVAEEEGRQMGIRDVRGVLLEALQTEVADLARDDPDRAIWLARRARALLVNGKRLDEEGSVSAARINALIHDVNEQRDERARRENATSESNERRALSTVEGLAANRFLEVLEPGNPETMAGVENEIVQAALANEDVFGIMGVSPEEGLPAQFQGLVRRRVRALRQALEEPSIDDREAVTDLEVAIRAGQYTSQEALTATMELLLAGGMSPQTFDRITSYIQENAEFNNQLSALPQYDTLVDQLSPSLILGGLPISVQNQLRTGRTQALNGISSFLLGQFNATTEGPIAQRQALQDALTSPEAQAFVTGWQQQVETAATAHTDTLLQLDALIQDWDFVGAREFLRENRKHINGDLVRSVQKDIRSEEEARDSELTLGSLATAGGREVYAAVSQILASRPTPPDAARINEAARAAEERYLALFREQALQRSLKGSERATSLQDASSAAVAAVLERYGEAQVPTIEGVGDLAEGGDPTGTRYREAQDLYGESSSHFRSTFFSTMQVPDVDPEAYLLVDQLGTGGAFTSAAERQNSTFLTWNSEALRGPIERQDDRWVSFHAAHEIPSEAVMGAPVTIQHRGLVGSDIQKIAPELSIRSGNLRRDDFDTVRAAFEARGIEVTFQKATTVRRGARVTLQNEFTAQIRRSFTIGDDVALSPWATRYFQKIGDYHRLPEETKRAFLTRLGLDAEGDLEEEGSPFNRSNALFSLDQEATIADWNRRKAQ